MEQSRFVNQWPTGRFIGDSQAAKQHVFLVPLTDMYWSSGAPGGLPVARSIDGKHITPSPLIIELTNGSLKGYEAREREDRTRIISVREQVCRHDMCFKENMCENMVDRSQAIQEAILQWQGVRQRKKVVGKA